MTKERSIRECYKCKFHLNKMIIHRRVLQSFKMFEVVISALLFRLLFAEF